MRNIFQEIERCMILLEKNPAILNGFSRSMTDVCLFRQSGNSRIFLYPFSSTGKDNIYTPITVQGLFNTDPTWIVALEKSVHRTTGLEICNRTTDFFKTLKIVCGFDPGEDLFCWS